ncbi:MAG: hypothetical protein ACPGES_02090 [Coraliomargarita sp.]
MKTTLTFVYLGLSLFTCASALEKVTSAYWKEDALTKSRKENHRNEALDYYLSSKKVVLPKGNFILIAHQAMGIVASCMVIELETRKVRILPGTHAKNDERIIELQESEYDYLAELNSSDLMMNFPSQSGKFGFDGHSLVIYSKSDTTERYISHWDPEYMGLDIFTSIYDYFQSKP